MHIKVWGITLFPSYFDIWPNEPLFISTNSENIWGSSLIYLQPLSLCFIFFFAFCIYSATCPICEPLLLNAKSVVQHLFYFDLKRTNNNKRVNNKRWHWKILLQIQFFVKLVIDSRVRNIAFFWVCAIFTNIKVENIRRNCSLTLESRTW